MCSLMLGLNSISGSTLSKSNPANEVRTTLIAADWSKDLRKAIPVLKPRNKVDVERRVSVPTWWSHRLKDANDD